MPSAKIQALPPEHLDMGQLAGVILRHVLASVRACFEAQPDPFPKSAYADLLSRLCPVDGSAVELPDEWVRQLGAVMMEVQLRE